jgi:hypothetical protein
MERIGSFAERKTFPVAERSYVRNVVVQESLD